MRLEIGHEILPAPVASCRDDEFKGRKGSSGNIPRLLEAGEIASLFSRMESPEHIIVAPAPDEARQF